MTATLEASDVPRPRRAARGMPPAGPEATAPRAPAAGGEALDRAGRALGEVELRGPLLGALDALLRRRRT